jgi:hypothetical protein
MTFQVPPSKASKGQDKFTFKIGDETYTVKKAKFLTVGEAERINRPDRTDTDVLDLFGPVGSKVGDAVRGLDEAQFEALMDAWTEDSAVTPGESEASSA